MDDVAKAVEKLEKAMEAPERYIARMIAADLTVLSRPGDKEARKALIAAVTEEILARYRGK